MIFEVVRADQLRAGDEIEMTQGGTERIEFVSKMPSGLVHLQLRDGAKVRIRPAADMKKVIG